MSMFGSKKKGDKETSVKGVSRQLAKTAWDIGGTCPVDHVDLGGHPLPVIPITFHLFNFSTKVGAFTRDKARGKGVSIEARVDELFPLALVYVASYMRTVEKTSLSAFAGVQETLTNVFLDVLKPMAVLIDSGATPPRIGLDVLPPEVRDLAAPKLVMENIIDYLNEYAK